MEEDRTHEDRLLMLAVTGEPLPDDDPGSAAVAADVALLREQVRGLGDALASRPPAPAPAPAPVRIPVRRRRPFRLALGTLVVACAASFFGGLFWLGAHAPGDSDTSAGSDKSAAQDSKGKSVYPPAMHIACSRVLVEGRVVSVTPRADGDVRVVVDVKRYYRPERSVRDHPTIALTLDGSAREDLKAGTYTLIRTPVHPQDREDWETGWGVGDARGDILDALPRAKGLHCAGPGY
ncbi:hypothetical protein [Streptomyces longispororuber]|uniref:hypothetical protein n=1 Tax=Streptomyces longispororuber TaxID=68230 RepID=UPI00210948FA|nr:hypothetical protein [Streptomyces longispororuber]MCQ4211963.1 hypothetical protein [Streptomyces longispororuber]